MGLTFTRSKVTNLAIRTCQFLHWYVRVELMLGITADCNSLCMSHSGRVAREREDVTPCYLCCSVLRDVTLTNVLG